MDVSNASGYDGTTVAADACFVAQGAHGPHAHRPRRDAAPDGAAGGEDVRAGLRDGGRRGGARRRHDRPCAVRRGGRRRRDRDLPAAERVRLPRARARRSPRPRPRAARFRSPTSTSPRSGVLEAPGNYGCAMAIGEGQSIGNYQSYGGPHYGFLAARSEFIRRMPGRIVGETTDLDGERGFVLTLQTREQHIRREKATSNMTTNQTLLALGGLITLCWLGPEGLRELGETCAALAAYARERVALPARLRPADLQGGRVPHARSPRARSSLAAREARRPPRVPARARLPGARRRAPRRAHREAHAGRRRPPRRGARGGVRLMELIFEKSRPGRRAGRVPSYGLPVPEIPAELARKRPPRLPEGAGERGRPPLHGARRPQLRDRHGLLPARQLHDEAQPARERARGRAPGVPRPPSAAGGRGRAGRARADVGAPADPRRDRRTAGGDAAAGCRLAGRADGTDADACGVRRPRRARPAT